MIELKGFNENKFTYREIKEINFYCLKCNKRVAIMTEDDFLFDFCQCNKKGE